MHSMQALNPDSVPVVYADDLMYKKGNRAIIDYFTKVVSAFASNNTMNMSYDKNGASKALLRLLRSVRPYA